MKKYILSFASLLAVATFSCRKIETDGEKEIVVINGGGTGSTTGKRVELSGRIAKDTTLRKGDENILRGKVYITNGATITIEPGAVVRGSFTGSDVAVLVITRGAKINARGTATEPIVFTSASPNPQSGDWGGIVLCGKAKVNTSFNGKQGVFQVEGEIDNAQGDGLAGYGDLTPATPVDNDNSGVLSYVRIEYAGYAFQPDKEVNSLTLAAVGSGTAIDHIQVTYAKDDAYEWFGGTVNAKYLIAWKTQDDDFDTDNGYSGKVQFGLVIRDSAIADISTSEAFESDNNSSGTTATPKTSAIFSNITAIGPRATSGNSGNSLYRAGAQIRRNSALSIYNSVIMGWPQGILVDASTGTPTDKNIQDSSLRIRYTTLAGNGIAVKYAASTSQSTGWTDADATVWFTNPFFGNTILNTTADAKLIQPFNYGTPDPTPFGGSNGYVPINAGGNFTDTKLNDPFFTVVTFRGAIAPAGVESTWWKGWTKFE
ncbi:MAG: hypothetical protein EOO10_02125 [Chitinophagaceae bacterium]|nr:MAG: hypothetical protein EOO10_02125 [Chitinophagaceae bacterium]